MPRQAGQDGATCLDSRAGRWVFRGYWAAAGLAALALLASKAYFTSLAPTPHDLRVLGQGQWLPDSEAAVHVRLVDHVTAAPVPGVPVVVELVGPVGPALKLADLTTGPDGSARPRFRVPDWADGGYELRVNAREAARSSRSTARSSSGVPGG